MTPTTSPRFVLLFAFLFVLVAAVAGAQPPLETLRLETVATGLPGSPVAITHAGDERLFITLKEGLVVIWDGERILPEPFLDLRGQVALRFEQGLLSVAFHPDYADNGLFFVNYTNLASDTVVARYRVSADDPDRADPDSREEVLFVDQPTVIHNGGQLQFGPDGFLYIGMGDGGGPRDPFCNGQRRDTVLGKMLRFEVDVEATEPPFLRIPDDNPFVGPGDPPDEVWALGLRNPWRFSFDRLTGDLFIADVGQGAREEVSFQPADSPGGENYGWRAMEGTLCQSDQGCPLPVPPCGDPAYTDPIIEYLHTDGNCAVVGGYVYRGSALPGLDGIYFFGDFCSGIVRAALRPESEGEGWEVRDLPLRVPNLTSLGEDVDGEIFLASLGGTLFRLSSLAEPPVEQLRLDTLATGLPGSPVAVTHAGDERLFLTLKEGLVVIWDGERILPEPFLDLRGQVALQFEQGLLSVAFHPDYGDNGFFFVDYTDLAGDTVVARFRVSDDDPNRADPDSREVVLLVDQPRPAHNGGQLQFGPDGFLYIGMGDGGTARDEFCNGQRRDTVLGKMLRIDVDVEAGGPPFFHVPDDNPFVGPGDPPDEVWALGLRNPWRFSFDRLTGDLFIADVGQAAREEVNYQPAGSPGGENYGWKVMEGTTCQSDEGCPLPVPPCGDPAYTDPILEYDHGAGDCAVVGGYVYRGSAVPGLDGVYLFGDFCSGIVRAARRPESEGASWEVRDLPLRVPGLTSFGEDVDGEIYLASLDGSLFRLRSVTEQGPCTPGPNHLCLVDGRFRVEARWTTQDGGSGPGVPRPLTEDTGTFWFFDPDNVEVVVKVIDACGPFDRFWVFAGGLTNVEVRLTVVDTEAVGSGLDAVREYSNPLGTPFAPIQDTQAFATCP